MPHTFSTGGKCDFQVAHLLLLLLISNPAVSAYASVSTGPHYNIICVIGLPVDSNIEEFLCVCKRTEGFEPEPMTRITALLANEEQVR